MLRLWMPLASPSRSVQLNMRTGTVKLPSWQTAIVAQETGKLVLQTSACVPSLPPQGALVHTKAVAINPADAKMLDYSAVAGAVHGYDFSGIIVALGADAPTHLAVGDRVAGLVHGMNSLQPDVGAFAEYVPAHADLLLKIPDSMSFEEGASLGTGVATAGLALFHNLAVPASLDNPWDGDSGVDTGFVLVAGGSTATGTRAIQFLKQ